MSGGTQYYVDLPFKPIVENGQYIVWKLSKQQLRTVLHDRAVYSWKRLRVGAPAEQKKFHPTAITRLAPPRPMTRVLGMLPEYTKRYRVLYHGMGRDTHGLEALSREGRYKVVGYDPYHPEKKVRAFPRGQFREVWSIYTLNTVSLHAGLKILEEIHSLLIDSPTYNTDVFAIIAVRRDNS